MLAFVTVRAIKKWYDWYLKNSSRLDGCPLALNLWMNSNVNRVCKKEAL